MNKLAANLLYAQLLDLFSKADPIGITGPPDEYEPEVDAVMRELPNTNSVEEVTDLVYKTFIESFDDAIAGSKASYEGLGHAVWALYNQVPNTGAH